MPDIEALLNEYVDIVCDLSQQIASSIISIEPDMESMSDEEFVASVFSSTESYSLPIDKSVANAKAIIKNVKSAISKGAPIDVSLHKKRVFRLNNGTSFVRVTNYQALPEVSGESIAYYKKVESVIIAYRSLLLEFNSLVVEYNLLNRGQTLSPLASVDVSPLQVGNDVNIIK
jgi:hypothetical protein